MSEQPEEPQRATRGEAAWKEAKARIAARNDKVRREGKQRREAYERAREDSRRAEERRGVADLLRKHPAR
jgi:hypothetical protein